MPRAVLVLAMMGVAAAAVVDPAGGVTVAPAAPPPSDADVTVEAPKDRAQLERQARQYVESVLVTGDGESVERWQVPACPFVAGLTPARNRFIAERIVQVAMAAGVPLAPEGCAPNLLVIATTGPEGLLREWWHRDPRLFDTTRGAGGVARFIATPMPVRIWHNAMPGCPEGAATFRARGGTFYSECRENARLGSRLSWETVRTLYSAIVVIDLNRVGELSMGQVSDYIALGSFARLREQAHAVGSPSVLQLFAPEVVAKPAGLTRWDEAFLAALYRTRTAHATQVSELQEQMAAAMAR